MPFKTTPRFFTFFCGYLLFMCIGASLFLAIEEDVELEHIKFISGLKGEFLKRNPCVHYDELERILSVFERSNKKGLTISSNFTRWNFGQSLFFASTVVTTIGYGQITPASSSGKIFTILFALIGIPLTLSVLSALVERLLKPTTALLRWLNWKLAYSFRPFQIKLIHLLIILNIAIIFLILIPAGCFYYLEPEWNYFDAVYYCFLSITTIGFGDLTPGDSQRHLQKPRSIRIFYHVCTTVYIFVGVTYMMLALAVFCSIPQLNLGDLYTTQDDQLSSTSKEMEIVAGTAEGAQTRKEVKVLP